MNAARWSVALGLVAIASSLASAGETYLLQRDLKTDFMGDRFSHSGGLTHAKRALKTLFKEAQAEVRDAVDAAQGAVLSQELQEWGIGDEDKVKAELTGLLVDDGTHTLYRARGQADFLFELPGALPSEGPLAGATKIDPRSVVRVSIQGKRKGESLSYLKRPPELAEITLDELRRIQSNPAAARHTAFAALLRRAWGVALNGNTDDVKTIEAVVEINLKSLRSGTADESLWAYGQRLDERTTDLLLGRSETTADWWLGLAGRKPTLPSVDDETAEILEGALGRTGSRYSASEASEEDWRRVGELRRGRPERYTVADKTFLKTGRIASGAASLIPE